MHQPIRVTDLELSEPVPDFDDLRHYAFLQLLVRWRGQPIHTITVPVRGDRCLATDIVATLMDQCTTSLIHQLLHLAVENPPAEVPWNIQSLVKLRQPPKPSNLPTISVAVCTRDRPESLVICLQALQHLAHPPLEILVIDNAPKTQATRELIESSFPQVSYILEPNPGLDWARNRAIASASGDIIAYTDDDVVVDSLWTDAIARIFADHEETMAVTGLVVPYELGTEPQILFEKYGGFGRGYIRKWYRPSDQDRRHLAQKHAGAGKFGTGANMAFRRTVFREIGPFDPALDVGTVTHGGGDLDMFFRVLKFGHTLVYEPAAMVRHRHRRDFEHLHTQIENNGIGFYSHLVRNAIEFPEERLGLAKLAIWWLRAWNLRRWLDSKFKPAEIPHQLIAAELFGSFVGLFRYRKAKQQAQPLLAASDPILPSATTTPTSDQSNPYTPQGIAIRSYEITSTPVPIDDVKNYHATRLILTRRGSAIGEVQIQNLGCSISPARIADEVIHALGNNLLDSDATQSAALKWAQSMADLQQFAIIPAKGPSATQPEKPSASIVIATHDRPDALRDCLRSLSDQKCSHATEIIVVDNHPESGLTPAVIAEFPAVIKVDEPRGGLSYARNTGFAASTGDILVCTDDDVTFPNNWLENLLEPFTRNDVMLVTGNVLPLQLETQSQIEFENYGGLGRGFERREFNRCWFNSFRRKAVPTWTIGATANAAIRASLLHDPAIGLLDESLGTGTPTGCSEDTYLFYKTLKAGHTIIYTPKAFVWHKHRISVDGLHRQILNYSKGHSAYNLTTFLRDHDCRGLVRIFAELPLHHLQQLIRILRGRCQTSLRTIFLEIKGNALGPLALWKSRRRVRMLGTSGSYLSSKRRREFTLSNPLEHHAEHSVNSELEIQS
ncbi:MAG: glycosyltransferase [Akkermansiaceae bacterium]|nr:glycosyltransferase [Akkermansiaceae bacterium]